MTSSPHDDLGVYLTGSLGPDEEASFRSHLADCAACRHEVGRLGPLPALLAELPRPDALTATPARATTRRRSRRAVLAAGAVTALAAAAAVAVAVVPDRSRPAPVGRTIALRPVSGAAAGSADLEARPWGTQIVLHLRSLPRDETFELVVATAGGASPAGSWSSTADGRALVELASAAGHVQITGLRVTDASGTVVAG